MSRKYKGIPQWVWVSFFVIALAKITLTSSQTVFAIGGANHDDRLFLSLADSLLHGQWLGDYNNLTLAKGPFYPLWIAVNSLLGMHLLTSQQLLYAFSCLIFVLALRPLHLKPIIVLLIYALLLFNPMSYTNGPSTRVIREGIYASETLLVVAGFTALFLRWNWEIKSVVRWSIISGFSLAALWLTREEGSWILPTVILLTAIPAYWLFKNSLDNRFKRLALLTLPFCLLFISVSLVSALNFYHYGVFTPVEYKQKDFLSAYGALTRVKHNPWQPDIPVPAETRMRIYKVSPAFAELKPYLEGDIGKIWSSNSVFWSPATETWEGDKQKFEISGGWFMWALRDAVAAAGHYTSGEAAATYYRKLASEVNTAIAQGKLEASGGVRATMTPLFHKEYLNPLLKAMAQSSVFMINFREFDPRPGYSIGNESQLALFRDLTRDKLSNNSTAPNPGIRYLEMIGKIYSSILPPLVILSLFCYFILTVTMLRSLNNFKIWMISSAMLGAIFTRIFIVSFIHITSFPGINTLYLSPAYPLMLAFVSVMINQGLGGLENGYNWRCSNKAAGKGEFGI